MKKLILILLLVFTPTLVVAGPDVPPVLEPVGGFDSYAVLTCKGAPVDPQLSAFYSVSPNSVYPNSLEIVSLNPARYEALLVRCRNTMTSNQPLDVVLSTANYGNNGCRNENQGCTQTSQCCEGTCDNQLGFCKPLVDVSIPSR